MPVQLPVQAGVKSVNPCLRVVLYLGFVFRHRLVAEDMLHAVLHVDSKILETLRLQAGDPVDI